MKRSIHAKNKGIICVCHKDHVDLTRVIPQDGPGSGEKGYLRRLPQKPEIGVNTRGDPLLIFHMVNENSD